MNKHTAVRNALAICMQIGEPVLLWGSPGEGKSAMIESLSALLGRRCEVVIGSIRDATDFAGLPMRTDAGVSFVPPTWANRCLENPNSVIFLDELNTAAPATQAAMLRVVLDREVGASTHGLLEEGQGVAEPGLVEGEPAVLDEQVGEAALGGAQSTEGLDVGGVDRAAEDA